MSITFLKGSKDPVLILLASLLSPSKYFCFKKRSAQSIQTPCLLQMCVVCVSPSHKIFINQDRGQTVSKHQASFDHEEGESQRVKGHCKGAILSPRGFLQPLSGSDWRKTLQSKQSFNYLCFFWSQKNATIKTVNNLLLKLIKKRKNTSNARLWDKDLPQKCILNSHTNTNTDMVICPKQPSINNLWTQAHVLVFLPTEKDTEFTFNNYGLHYASRYLGLHTETFSLPHSLTFQTYKVL